MLFDMTIQNQIKSQSTYSWLYLLIYLLIDLLKYMNFYFMQNTVLGAPKLLWAQ